MSAPLVKISHSTFTVTIASPAVFTRVGHGLSANDIVYLETTGSLPTGLSTDTPYYVISSGLTADEFQVSATKGGSAINSSGTQSGTHTLVVDRTTQIMPSSLRVNRAITSQVDTAAFTVVVSATSDWRPSTLDDIKVLEDSTAIFAGTIIEIEEEMAGGNVQTIKCNAKDYGFELDRQLVANVYENTTVQAVIEDIIDNYTTGFTYNNVVATGVVDYLAFKYEYPTKCLQQLAELVGYDWYVDSDKDIHFFSKSSIAAPFNLTDTNGYYYFDSLKIKSDVKNLRNTIIVRGGTYEGDTLTEEIVADGDQTTFLFAYKYSNTSFTINGGSPINVGIDFINDPASYDALYNFNEKALKFEEADKPAQGDVVAISGNPHIPVIIRKRDPVKIAEFGAFEYKIIDTSINSKEAARTAAAAELRGWSDTINEGSFETNQAGLNVGQTINIQSTIRGLNQDYVINRMSSYLVNGNEWRHKVGLVTTQTFGMIEFLQKLLIQKDKEIRIDANEVVDLVEGFFETITLSESVTVSTEHNQQTETMSIGENATVQALNYAVGFAVDGFTPTGTKRSFILDGSPLG